MGLSNYEAASILTQMHAAVVSYRGEEAGWSEAVALACAALLNTDENIRRTTECHASTSTKEYSDQKLYSVGDYCIHDGEWYMCTSNIESPELWTKKHWTLAL